MFDEIKNKISRDAYKTINRVVNYFSFISQINHLEIFNYKNRNYFYNVVITVNS